MLLSKQLKQFILTEHDRLVTHYNVKNNPKTKYTMLAKCMEELGELSEQILKHDSMQRSKKLQTSRKELEGEFADVLFTTLILAQELNIDMEKAMLEKLVKVQRRKY
jgi:NTP pyrophosphatase (non-canonical NTP hydrolase)